LRLVQRCLHKSLGQQAISHCFPHFLLVGILHLHHLHHSSICYSLNSFFIIHLPAYRIILAVGFSMLVLGTLANSRTRKSCAIAHRHLLSIGGILCFLHGMITVAYYVSATATAREKEKHRNHLPGSQSTA
jgi:hypothetical protein